MERLKRPLDELIIVLRSTGHLRLNICLTARVADNLINFPAVVKKEGLVSSSYSSAIELPTAITDKLHKQSESSSAGAFFFVSSKRTTVP